MRFAAIKPHKNSLVWVDTDMLRTAEASVGLVNVDHGIFWRKDDGLGLAYTVHEFGLFIPPDQQKYAAVFGKLIAGNCIVYAFDVHGETIPVTEEMISVKDIKWLPDTFSVEMAIAHGLAKRPTIAVNDKVVWRWPEPPGPGMMREKGET